MVIAIVFYHTGEKYESIPNSGFVIMMGVAHAKMMEVLFCEYEGRPIRINEVQAVLECNYVCEVYVCCSVIVSVCVL